MLACHLQHLCLPCKDWAAQLCLQYFLTLHNTNRRVIDACGGLPAVHACLQDLGEFTFKGISGSHSLVSVCTKALAGRSFPHALRKAKGTQLTRGQGLLYQLHMQAAAVERASSLPSPRFSSRHQHQQADFQLAECETAAAAFAAERASSLPCSPSCGGQQQQLGFEFLPTWTENNMAQAVNGAAAGVSLDGCGGCLHELQLDSTAAVDRQAVLPAGRQSSLGLAEATPAAAASCCCGSSSCSASTAAAGCDTSPTSRPVTDEAMGCCSRAVGCCSRAGAQLQLSAAPSLTAPAGHIADLQQS